MFEHKSFLAHLYTSFGEMSPQKCELLQFSCIHKILFLCEMRKDLNHKDGGCASELCGGGGEGAGQKPQGKRAVLSASSDPTPALACGHVLFRDFLTACILLLEEETGQGCGRSPPNVLGLLNAHISTPTRN